jgi:hypothetical protein
MRKLTVTTCLAVLAAATSSCTTGPDSVAAAGRRGWQTGANRAQCVINAKRVQDAVRTYQASSGATAGAPIPWDRVMPQRPTCPEGETYTWAKTIPAKGQLACRCGRIDHVPINIGKW